MLKRNLFYVLLVLAGLVAAYGYWAWRLDPYLVGTVEARLHPVGAREGGRIQEILVTTGSRVSAGQTLARLDVSDLAAERDLLQEQLVSWRRSWRRIGSAMPWSTICCGSACRSSRRRCRRPWPS